MTIDTALLRVRDFVSRRLAAGMTATAIAEAAGVDNKLVAMAMQPKWNPTAGTLRKFESLLPDGWQAGDPLPPPASEAATEAASAEAAG
jgi:transcriptional regulator with XRE-family HTH domain